MSKTSKYNMKHVLRHVQMESFKLERVVMIDMLKRWRLDMWLRTKYLHTRLRRWINYISWRVWWFEYL